MPIQLSGADLYFMMDEIKQLIGGKIDKIYQIEKKDFIFNFHVPNLGKKSLRICVPDFLYFTSKRIKTPQTPPGYCMFLRKRLANARVRDIEQIGLERIMRIHFNAKEADFIMFLEMFSKGNLILCDENLMIISPLERQIWKGREVKPKVKYELPKARVNPFDIDIQELRELIFKSKKDKLVTFLAIDLGLGGKYAEYISKNLDKDLPPNKSKPEEVQKALLGLMDMEITPGIVDGQPFPFGESKFKTLSEAYDEMINVEESHENTVQETKKDKTKDIIKNQLKHIETLQRESEKNAEIGEKIYSHYQEIKEIMDNIEKAEEYKQVISIDKKAKTMVLELN
jgi:predicted ribosome quality control (RQC) complex YloA/Tae2 family protein